MAAPKGPAMHIPMTVPKPAPISVQLAASAICQPSSPLAQACIAPLIPSPKAKPIAAPTAAPRGPPII